MSNNKSGGPAFPSGEAYSANGVISRKGPLYEGMTLRDYFAAKAMEALLHNWKEEVIPQMAYKIADEMLAEREK